MRTRKQIIKDIINNRKKKGFCEETLRKIFRKNTLSELNKIYNHIRRY